MKSSDFVVVRAETTGCVMAARFSEDAGAKVLLLEAGSGKLPSTRSPSRNGTEASLGWHPRT